MLACKANAAPGREELWRLRLTRPRLCRTGWAPRRRGTRHSRTWQTAPARNPGTAPGRCARWPAMYCCYARDKRCLQRSCSAKHSTAYVVIEVLCLMTGVQLWVPEPHATARGKPRSGWHSTALEKLKRGVHVCAQHGPGTQTPRRDAGTWQQLALRACRIGVRRTTLRVPVQLGCHAYRHRGTPMWCLARS